MAPLLSFIALLSFAIAALSSPVVIRDTSFSLPIAKHVNITSLPFLLKRDQARSQALANRLATQRPSRRSRVESETIYNDAVAYVASVAVGTQPTNYTLLIDTGSSNTWVGAGQPYVPTSSSVDTGEAVYAEYGSGSFGGYEYTDDIAFGSFPAFRQSIGVAQASSGFQGYDGILGIGPTDLTYGTVQDQTIPTVTDTLYHNYLIANYLVSISFQPEGYDWVSGELMFGGTDSSQYTGSINYAPLTTTSPASEYWGMNQSITYGTDNTPILTNTAGIVDTGTTLTLIATDAYLRYQTATGATLDSVTGLLCLPNSAYDNLESLNFIINGVTYELTPNAQIWPRSLNAALGGSSDNIYLIIADIGTWTGAGLDFVNGYTFLERFYTVYDTGGQRVGFAQTPYTNATTN